MKISCSFRNSFHYLACNLLGQRLFVCKAEWKLAGELLIGLNQRFVPAPADPPCPVHPLSRICGGDPVIDRRWNQANRVGSLGLLADDNQRIGIASLPRGAEMLDLVESRFIQVEVLPQGRRITRLPANDLGCRVLYDPGAMGSRLRLRANKILRRLADSPHARIPLARRAEQLHDLWRKHGRVEQEPAFIET